MSGEERYRALVTASSDAVYSMSPDWSELRYLDGREFVADTHEPSRNWLDRYINPDDQPEVLRAIRAAVTTKSIFQLEHRILRADGTTGWTFSRAIPILDDRGDIVEWLGMASDVSRRKLAEESLAQQRRLYEAILTNTPDLAYVFDLDHRFIYANEGLLKMWGKSWDEAIGKNCLELGYEPWHAAMHDREIEQVIASKQPVRGEVPFTGTFGRRYYDYLFVPVVGASGEVEAIAGTTRDVTERKLAEESLQEVRARLDAALWAGEIGTFVWDVVADRLHGDRNFAVLFDIPLDNSGAAPLANFVEAIHPDDRDKVTSLVRKTVETGLEYEIEYRITSGGRERWVIARGKVERDADDKVVRFPGVLLDITDRKRAEEALQEADRRKDEFLATLSHELRNPLAPIRHAVKLLQAPDLPGRDIRAACDIIDRQSRHMSWLLEELLDVSRITRGALELRPEPLELAAVIDTAVEAARPFIDSRRHTLTLDLPDEPLNFEADGLRLAQIISNLLTNSAKYTRPGGEIRLHAGAKDGELGVTVADNGIGISPDMLPRVFEMFSQAKSAFDRSEGGLGIGLALVRGLAELHGGTVEAISDGANQGSEFTVRLPLRAPVSRPPETADTLNRDRQFHAGRKVLVADDNKDAAESLKMLLKVAGYDVRTVHDGQAALETAATFEPDAALIDIGMPRLNGYEVAQRARTERWGQRALLVALTGWGQEEDKRRALAAGFDHHLTKPVDAAHLQALLADPVRRGASRQPRATDDEQRRP